LDVAHQWQRSPLFPEIQFKTGIDHCDRLEKRLIEADQLSALPEWKDELYLEFHRGCYTTHGDQKLANRTCENLLFEAELWLSLAGIQGLLTTQESKGYHDQLQAAWKKVLLNQFHDILPGSAVPEAYGDANQDWGFAEGTARSVLDAVMERWGRAMVLDAKPSDDAIPYLVFNSVDGERASTVEVVIPEAKPDVHWQVIDSRGKLLQSQILCSREEGNEGDRSLLVALPPFAGIGYQVIYLRPGTATEDQLPEDTGLGQLNGLAAGAEYQLSNEFIQVEIDPETGLIARLINKGIDKGADGTVMTGPGPQLQLFKDDGQYWDAWNIDPEYETHRLADPKLVDIAWLEQGPLRQCLRTVFLWGDSTFEQDYILDATDPYLTVKTRVHWKERHVLLKMAIAVDESWDPATYHIPGGAIARPTRPKTEAEKAKWEVPALQWADLSHPDQTRGLSILNDCKHGYDAKPGQLRLTLLRGATWPNPDADRGEHCFSYALYPHGGSWQEAGTMHHGDCFNRPLRAIAIVPDAPSISAQPPAATLLSLGQPNLRLMTLKRSEEHLNHWILRCHESAGEFASLDDAKVGSQSFSHPATTVQMTDLLEQSAAAVPETLTPWQIATFKIAQNCSKIKSV
ncbi:MAG: glycoside hydrolase family 38 C-terminal domain-containing protein, partial [Cyanobacteria bacterium P01_H01_bin.130]